LSFDAIIKSFFKFDRLDNVTVMLSELGLPSFYALFGDCFQKFNQR